MGSRAGEVRLDWGGEERLFRLGLGELRKIQEETGAGPTGMARRCMLGLGVLRAIRERDLVTLARLGDGPFAEPQQIRFVLLQGLLGAGSPMGEATTLIKLWADGGTYSDNLIVAYEVCMASILGPEDEPVGETVGEGQTPPQTVDSSSDPTSSPAPSLD